MRLDWITGVFQCLDEQEMRNLYDKEKRAEKGKRRGKKTRKVCGKQKSWM